MKALLHSRLIWGILIGGGLGTVFSSLLLIVSNGIVFTGPATRFVSIGFAIGTGLGLACGLVVDTISQIRKARGNREQSPPIRFFSLRHVLYLMFIVGMAIAWWVDRSSLVANNNGTAIVQLVNNRERPIRDICMGLTDAYGRRSIQDFKKLVPGETLRLVVPTVALQVTSHYEEGERTCVIVDDKLIRDGEMFTIWFNADGTISRNFERP